MLVQRVEWQVKRGRMQEALAVLREVKVGPSTPQAKRLYTSSFGQMGRIAYEFEWESLAEEEKVMDPWNASPEGAAFWKKWNELVEAGKNEIWASVEL